MKRRTRIISAVCAAALLGSAMTMPAAAYPMHMNGEAEVPLAQVLQMLENDKTAYVEKGESMYYGLKDPTPVGMYDNIFYATAEQDDLIQLNEYAYRIQLEQDVADVRELTEQLCGLLTKKENAEEPTADQALSTEESETRQLTMTAGKRSIYAAIQHIIVSSGRGKTLSVPPDLVRFCIGTAGSLGRFFKGKQYRTNVGLSRQFWYLLRYSERRSCSDTGRSGSGL